MSVVQSIDDSNFKAFDYDTSKVFIFSNLFDTGTFLNNTGGVLSFPCGTVLGRNALTGELSALDSAITTNGLNKVVGVLAVDIIALADAGTQDITFAFAGDVAEPLIVLQGAETLDTALQTATITVRDDMRRVGLNPVPSDELSKFDNN